MQSRELKERVTSKKSPDNHGSYSRENGSLFDQNGFELNHLHQRLFEPFS
jgi:hypothetical protein